MKLTVKDKDFLEGLKSLLESNDLTVNMKDDGLKRFVLRRNYGERIEKHFNMTRQGVRWRFQRLLNVIYVEAYETIFWVESSLGTELRGMALEVAKQRVELRKKAKKTGLDMSCRRQIHPSDQNSRHPQL